MEIVSIGDKDKLINCPACGHKVSKKAKACPNCGYPVYKNTDDTGFGQFIIMVVAILVALVIFSLLGGFNSSIAGQLNF